MNMGIHGVVFERSVTLKWFTSVALSPKQPNTAKHSRIQRKKAFYFVGNNPKILFCTPK